MDPQELLAQAKAAVAAGADPAAVEARLRDQFGFESLAALEAAARGPGDIADEVDTEGAALRRLNARGGSAVGDFLRMAAQGASFGFADELAGLGAAVTPGGKGYTEARDESRQRVEDLRGLNPGASLASELAGGVAVPGVGGLKAMEGAPALGKLVNIGAVEGGLLGAGESDGTALDRLAGAGQGVAAGALTGGAFGILGTLGSKLSTYARIKAGRPERIIASLKRAAKVPRGYREAVNAADQALKDVSQRVFRPLDEAHKVVTDPEVLSFVQRLAADPDKRSLVRAVSRKVANGDEAPSFSQVQEIRTRLRKRGLRDEVDELTSVMDDAFEGFSDANKEWANALRVREALDKGRKSARKSADEIRLLTQGLPPEAQDAFREGMLHQIVSKLGRREDAATGQLREFLDAGPETRAALREIFPDQASYEQFMGILKVENRAERVHVALRRLANIGGAAALGAGGYAAAQSFGGLLD